MTQDSKEMKKRN